MKAERRLWLVALLLGGLALANSPRVVGQDGILPHGAGGGEYTLYTDGSHVSDAQRQRIRAEIERNTQVLQLDPTTLSPTRVTLAWPLQAAGWLDVYDTHGISGFVDHNTAFPNQLLDYNCGDRTYDTLSGYNHDGTDFFTWPFAWNWMDQDAVQACPASTRFTSRPAQSMTVGRTVCRPRTSTMPRRGGGGPWILDRKRQQGLGALRLPLMERFTPTLLKSWSCRITSIFPSSKIDRRENRDQLAHRIPSHSPHPRAGDP